MAEPGRLGAAARAPEPAGDQGLWYEADAYCRWRSEIRGDTVRLPTWGEWQAACATGGEYPWGDAEPTPEHANYHGNVGAPTPVGLYPRGAGPHGHLDLAGNVWEWSAEEAEGRCFFARGGCWVDGARDVRAADRGGNRASGRGGGLLGFRVAVCRASP